MPYYTYSSPQTGKTKDIFQGMNDVHEYFDEEEGIMWERVFTVPQASIDTQIDPFNQNQFIDKTGNNKGKMGDVYDRSAEMSAKRAAKAGGVDPLKAKYYEEYSKKRKGKPHPTQIKEKMANTTIEI